MSQLEDFIALTIDGDDISMAEVIDALVVAGKSRFLTVAAEEFVLKKAAARMAIACSDVELQESCDQFRKSRNLHRIEDTQRWLSSINWSIGDFEKNMERRLIRNKIADQLATTEAVEQYFAEHRPLFDQVRLAQVVVDSESLAHELLAQIVDDEEDFGELAREHSQDLDSAKDGGELGVVNRRSLPNVLEAAVFAAGPGDTVGPIEHDSKFHLIHVQKFLFAELNVHVRQAIRQQLFDRWLADELAACKIAFPILENRSHASSEGS